MVMGYKLTDGERSNRVSEGALTTAFTLFPRAATLGSGAGVAEVLLATTKCFEYNALWNATSSQLPKSWQGYFFNKDIASAYGITNANINVTYFK